MNSLDPLMLANLHVFKHEKPSASFGTGTHRPTRLVGRRSDATSPRGIGSSSRAMTVRDGITPQDRPATGSPARRDGGVPGQGG